MGRTKRAEGHVSPSVARRLAAIEGCGRRGESLKAYAARTGQSAAALYEAKRAARRAGVLPSHRGTERPAREGDPPSATARFVEAVAAQPAGVAPATAGAVAWRLRLPGGALLESNIPLDPGLLERLVAGPGGRS